MAEVTAKQQVFNGAYALSSSTQPVLGIDLFRALAPITGITSIQELKVTLTADVLRGMATRPYTLVASQGAGTAIQVISASARVRFSGDVYDKGADLAIVSYSQLVAQFKCPDILQATHNGIWVFSPLATADTHEDALEEDTQLVIYDPTGTDSTEGDSEIDIYLSYKVITL